MSDRAAIDVLVSDISNALREIYYPDLLDVVDDFGAGMSINRIISRKMPVGGDGITEQFETGYTDTVRGSSNVNANFPKTNKYIVNKVKYRFDEDTPANNDFFSMKGRSEVHFLELKKTASVGGGAALELIERIAKDHRNDYERNMGLARYTPKSGVMANVNGELRQNNKKTWAAGATFSPGTGIRFKVDGGSHSHFWPGRRLTVQTSAGGSPFTCTVLGTNSADFSVSVTSDTTVSSNAFDNGLIYLEGQVGEGCYGIREWSGVAASGFAGGVDRTSPTYQDWLTFTEVDAASTPFSRELLDQMAENIDLGVADREQGNDIMMHTTRFNAFRKAIGEDALIVSNDNPQADIKIGSRTISYIHPEFEEIRLRADRYQNPSDIYWLKPATWVTYLYGGLGVDTLDNFYRKETDQAGGTGRGLIHTMDSFLPGFMDSCQHPKANGVWRNVTK